MTIDRLVEDDKSGLGRWGTVIDESANLYRNGTTTLGGDEDPGGPSERPSGNLRLI